MRFDDFNSGYELDLADSLDDELGFIGAIGDMIGDVISKTVKVAGETAKKVSKQQTLGQLQVPDDTSTVEADKAKREVLYSKIIDRVNKRLTPQINEMDKALFLSDMQTRATNEHNLKMNKDVFRKEVTKELKQLAKYLPSNHPVKTRINRL
jgi:hypothetical protein